MYYFLALVFSLLACLIPITVYFLVLTSINRRVQPTLVSGFWDSVALLAACSGFLLVAAPGIITALGQRSLRFPMPEGNQPMPDFDFLWSRWHLAWLLYYVIVVLGSALMIWFRSGKTVIYNVDVDRFDTLFQLCLENANVEQARIGAQVLLAPRPAAPASQAIQASTLPALPPAPKLLGSHGEVTIEPFPSMANVTLHWGDTPPRLRRRIEEELRRRLPAIPAQQGGAGAWLLAFSGMLVGIISLLIAVLILTVLILPRR